MDLLMIRGLIVAKYRTVKAFAHRIGYGESQLSKLLTGKAKWTQEIIAAFIDALEIPLEDVGNIFFGQKS